MAKLRAGKIEFRIGEYAKGGVIAATINEQDITLQCKDWTTGEVLFTETSDDRSYLINILCDWTSSYWASEVIDAIEEDEKGKAILWG